MSRRALLALLVTGLGLASPAGDQGRALREAARLDAEGKCDEAERYYRQALAEGAPSPALLNNFGNHFLVCGQPDKARPWFERLLKVNPAHANANLQLARIETGQKHGAKALEYLARVKDSDPAVRLLMAEASHWAGKRAAALAILDGIEREAGGDPRVLFQVGLTCARLGLYERAESAFNAVLARYPDDFDVLINLGRAAARARHYDRAERALEVALKVQPEDAGALLELGLLHAAQQNYSRAVYLLAQASQRAPKRPDILLALARAAENAGYYGDSAVAYNQYLQLRPEDDTARRDRGLVYGLSESRLPEGLKELEWYVRKHPEDPAGHYNLAQLSWRASPQKALDQLSAAVRAKADFAPARLARAWLLYRMGRAAESLPDLEAADKANPQNVRVLAQLGLVYLSLDRPADAEKVLRQALAISPEDPEVLLHLGRSLMALERDEEAQSFLDKFQRLRPQSVRGPRKEAGMIELAELPAAERTRREIERLRRDAHTHPGDPELQLSLATLLLADGRIDEAAREFRELLTRNAENRIWQQAGASLLAAEQYGLARQFLQRAATESPAARLDLAIALFFADGPQSALKVLEEVPEGEHTGDYLLVKARILDASGQAAEAAKVLDQGLRLATSRPQVAQQTAILLLRHDRKAEALELLSRAIRSSPDNPELLLSRAIALGLANQKAAAEKTLKEIESRWPEWDRPYLVHGLLLERDARPSEASRNLETAIALGSPGPAAHCALARLQSAPAPDPQCTCLSGLLEWLFQACDKP